MSGNQPGDSNTFHQKIIQEKPAVINRHVAGANNLYDCLFEQATDAIMITDFKGAFLDVNASLCLMFGYTKEELLGLNVSSLLDAEHIKAQPLRFDLLATGQNIFTERKMIHKEGGIIYVEANAKKVNDDCILVIARDITASKKKDHVLKRSEANLHTIFDTTETIYVLMDNDLRVISYNPRAALFAQKELNHNIGISNYFLQYFPVEKQAQLIHYTSAALNGKLVRYEVSYPQPGGLLHWYYVRLFPISKDDNTVYGLMMEVSDITEKKLLEQRLEEERTKRLLEITDAVLSAEEKERRAIGLELHDNVNQVLTTSRLYLGMAKREKGIKKLQMINEAEGHINTAIAEIRKLSHSLISPFLQEFGLLSSIEYLAETVAESSGIQIEKCLNFDEHKMDIKFRLAIYRIIQEGLNNILTHARATTINIKLVQVEDTITLHINDNGAGFDPSQKRSGIGLTNIKTRASLFRGEVRIISSPGKGCSLIVVFN